MAKSDKNLTVFGQETEFDGVLEFTDNLVITGKFHGTINATGSLDIEKSALCEVDKITAHSVVISGNVTGDVIAEEDSRIFLFDKETFLNLLTTDKNFLESFLYYQSEDAKNLNQTVKLLSMDKAEDRLFYLLRHNRNGLKFKNMSTLALQLGLTRESTSRLIHRLLREGQIYMIFDFVKYANMKLQFLSSYRGEGAQTRAERLTRQRLETVNFEENIFK